MEKTGRLGGVRRRPLRHLWQINCPCPPHLATHTTTLTDPRKPIQNMGEQESHPLTPSHAPHRHPSCPTATGLTGTLSLHRLLPSLVYPAQTPLPRLHLFPPLSTAPAPCTSTGTLTQASRPRSHQPATSTHFSILTSPIWELNRAGMEEEDLLRSTDAPGRRRSTVGASHR